MQCYRFSLSSYRCLPLGLGLAFGLIGCYQVPYRGGAHETLQPPVSSPCFGVSLRVNWVTRSPVGVVFIRFSQTFPAGEWPWEVAVRV
jgi:hypothetical protein